MNNNYRIIEHPQFKAPLSMPESLWLCCKIYQQNNSYTNNSITDKDIIIYDRR